jgi:hypothetical protein
MVNSEKTLVILIAKKSLGYFSITAIARSKCCKRWEENSLSKVLVVTRFKE